MGRQPKLDLLAELTKYGSLDTSRFNEDAPWKVLNEEAKRAKKRQEYQDRRLAAQAAAQERLAEEQRQLLQEQQDVPGAYADRG